MKVSVEDWYKRFGPMVLRRCKHMLRDDAKAWDATQDVFMKVLQYQDRLENTAPSSYLYRAATHVCLNKLRDEKRHPKTSDDEILLCLAKLDSGENSTLAKAALERIFGKEQASTRVMAVLHWVDGLTLEEVAKEVGLSVSGVRKRLRTLKARAKELDELLHAQPIKEKDVQQVVTA